MHAFISDTLSDLRGGRNTWRVLLLVTLPSFLIAIALPLVSQH
jgi:hypothetical protein